MLEIVINPDMTVQIPLVGTFCAYQGNEYEIMTTVTYQEERPGSAIPYFTTKCHLLRVNEEGDDLGEEAIVVDAEEITEI